MADPTSYVLKATDTLAAADVIAQAFMDDPLCIFMLPNQRTRLKTLRKFFMAYTEVNIRDKRGYGVGYPLAGVAFWVRPGQADLSINIKSLSLFIPLLLTAYPFGYYRARQVIKTTEALHQKFGDKPHFYLDNLGVLSTERGKGYSSRLIRPILEQADQMRMGVYTDTVTWSNVSLYEHFGFRFMEEQPVEGTSITIWSLMRPVTAGTD